MDSPQSSPDIRVSGVYRRRRGRERAGLTGRSVTTSLQKEAVLEMKPEQEATVTPPSTPPRKRSVSSIGSTPSTPTSSPSPSKVSIRRDIIKIFSPKRRREEDEAIVEVDDACYSPESFLSLAVESPGPNNHSVVGRMKPKRRIRPDSTSATPTISRAMSPLPYLNAYGINKRYTPTPDQVLPSSNTLSDEIAVPPPMLTPGRVAFSRIRSLPPKRGELVTQTRSVLQDEQEDKPYLIDLDRRWAELEDLENDEEGVVLQTSIQDIIGLRNDGQSRRFRDEFQYLVGELSSSMSLATRRATCVDIAKKVLSMYSEEDALIKNSFSDDPNDKVDEEALQSMPDSKDAPSTPFLKMVKTADLLSDLWNHMRNAACGNGQDGVLDLSLALVCAKIAYGDDNLASTLYRQKDFGPCMAGLLNFRPSGSRIDGQSKRLMGTLQDLALKSLPIETTEKVETRRIVLDVIAFLIDHLGQNESQNNIFLGGKGTAGESLAHQLWCIFMREAEIARTTTLSQATFQISDTTHPKEVKPDGHTVSQISLIFTGCIGQVEFGSKLTTTSRDLFDLLKYFAQSSLFGREHQRGGCDVSMETLCALLRLTLALVRIEDGRWTAHLFEFDAFRPFLIALPIVVADLQERDAFDEIRDDNHPIQSLLMQSLALMTAVQAISPAETRQIILHSTVRTSLGVIGCQTSTSVGVGVDRDTNKQPLLLFGRALERHRKRAHLDASAGGLTGALAVVLSLVILGEGEQCDSYSVEVLKQLVDGLDLNRLHECLEVIIASLEEFSAVVHQATLTHLASGSIDSDIEHSKEEHAFLAVLLQSLRTLSGSLPEF